MLYYYTDFTSIIAYSLKPILNSRKKLNFRTIFGQSLAIKY